MHDGICTTMQECYLWQKGSKMEMIFDLIETIFVWILERDYPNCCEIVDL